MAYFSTEKGKVGRRLQGMRPKIIHCAESRRVLSSKLNNSAPCSEFNEEARTTEKIEPAFLSLYFLHFVPFLSTTLLLYNFLYFALCAFKILKNRACIRESVAKFSKGIDGNRTLRKLEERRTKFRRSTAKKNFN